MSKLSLILQMMLLTAMFSRAQSECDAAACQEKIPEKGSVREQCSMARDAVSCAMNTLLNNPDCSEEVKSYVRVKVGEGRKIIAESCAGEAGGNGASSLTSSIVLCLTVIGVPYILIFK